MSYDPWYVEEEENPFGANMFLAGGALPYVPMDVNKKTGETDPYGIQTAGRQANYAQDVLQMAFDPRLAMLTSLQTGAPALDYNAFLGGGLGGAGGGGGQAVWQTPRLDSAERSSDPYLAAYARRIRAGENPEAIKIELTSPDSGITDQNVIDTYTTAIDEMFTEQAGFDRNAMQPRELSEVEKAWGKSGLPLPSEQYTAQNLPQDMELYSAATINPYLERTDTEISGLEKQLKGLQAQARYAPQPMMKSQILPGVGALKGFGGEGYEPAVAPLPDAGRDVRSSVYGDLMAGGPTPQQQTGERTKGAALFGLASTLRDALQDRDAGIERDMPYEISRGGVSSSGKRYSKVRGNKAALQASQQERSIGRKKQRAADVEQQVRGYYARQAQGRGRTPASDALKARISALRNMGLGL